MPRKRLYTIRIRFTDNGRVHIIDRRKPVGKRSKWFNCTQASYYRIQRLVDHISFNGFQGDLDARVSEQSVINKRKYQYLYNETLIYTNA